jgi:hypothetical protein
LPLRSPLNFFETEFEFRGDLIGLKSARQSAPRRIACGTMTAVSTFESTSGKNENRRNLNAKGRQ